MDLPWEKPGFFAQGARALAQPLSNTEQLPGGAGPVGNGGALGNPGAPFSIPEPEGDEPGLLGKIGDILDRPGNAVRGILAGRPEALKGLIPFGQTLGLYDPRTEHVSGQDVNHALFGMDKSDDFFSGPGLAGLATEFATDPVQLLPGFFGLKAATAEGRAAEQLAGHLAQARKLGADKIVEATNEARNLALKQGVELSSSYRPTIDFAHPQLGYDILRGGEYVAPQEIAQALAQRPDAIGESTQKVLANNAAHGLDTLGPLPNAGDRVRAGQEAFLSVGGHYDPFGLMRAFPKYNPITWLPKIPGLTDAIELPQKTLIEAPEAAQAVQDVWRKLTDNQVVNPIKNLFTKAPGVAPAAARVLEQGQRDYQAGVHAGVQAALAEQAQVEQALGGMKPGMAPSAAEAAEQAQRQRLGIEPIAGDIADLPGMKSPGTAEVSGLTPDIAPKGPDIANAYDELRAAREAKWREYEAAAVTERPELKRQYDALAAEVDKRDAGGTVEPWAAEGDENVRRGVGASAEIAGKEVPAGGRSVEAALQEGEPWAKEVKGVDNASGIVERGEVRAGRAANEGIEPGLEAGGARAEQGGEGAQEAGQRLIDPEVETRRALNPNGREMQMIGREAPPGAALPPDALPFNPRRPKRAEVLPIEQIHADPERLQYKIAPNADGSTGTFVDEHGNPVPYNRDVEGTLDVWKDPEDGKVYVVNGHNRLSAARRAGESEMAVKYMDAETASEARAKGAMLNIAAGRGTPFDAATFFRETHANADELRALGFKLSDSHAGTGLALSKLDPALFQKALNGEIPINRAAIVGRSISDPLEQARTLEYLKKKKVTDAVAQELVEMRANAPKRTITENSLFGVDERTESLYLQRAELQAAVKEKLGKQARTFGFIGNEERAGTIADHGVGSIKTEEARKVADEARDLLYTFDKLKQSTFSAMLNEGAERVADGARKSSVASEIIERLKQHAAGEPVAAEAGVRGGVGAGEELVQPGREVGRYQNPAVTQAAIPAGPIQTKNVPPEVLRPTSRVESFTDLLGQEKSELRGYQGRGEQANLFGVENALAPEEKAAAAGLEADRAKRAAEAAEGQTDMFGREAAPAETIEELKAKLDDVGKRLDQYPGLDWEDNNRRTWPTEAKALEAEYGALSAKIENFENPNLQSDLYQQAQHEFAVDHAEAMRLDARGNTNADRLKKAQDNDAFQQWMREQKEATRTQRNESMSAAKAEKLAQAKNILGVQTAENLGKSAARGTVDLHAATNADELRAAISQTFNVKPEEAEIASSMFDARARAWAENNPGASAEDYYKTRLAGVSKETGRPGLTEGQKAFGSHQLLADGKSIINAFESADFGTFMHEFGHVLRHDLSGEELSAAESWLGVKKGKWAASHSEKFANAFQEWFQEGKAPTPAMEGVFEKARRVLGDVWNGVKEFIKGPQKNRIQMSDEVRGTFERLFGSKPIDELATRGGVKAGEELFETGQRSSARLEELRRLSGEARDRMMGLERDTPEFRAARKEWMAVNEQMMNEHLRVEASTKSAQASKEQSAMTKYLIEAGQGTAKAADQAEKLSAGLDPETARRIGDHIELNKAEAPEIVNAANAFKDEYSGIIKAEQARLPNSHELNSEAIDYVPHILAPGGGKVHGELIKDPDRQLELLTRLEAKRRGMGVAGGDAAMAPFVEQRFERAGKVVEMGREKVTEVPAWMTKGMKDFFEKQAPDVQQFLASNKLKNDFNAFKTEISKWHESQIPRLAAFRDLSVSQINDTYKEMGAGKNVFNENPAAQLAARKFRHVRAMSAADFMDRMGEQLGTKLEDVKPTGPAVPGAPTEHMTPDGQKVYGIPELQDKGIYFPDKPTAAAVQKFYTDMKDPQKAEGILGWYDRTTHLYKAYMTSLFPAFYTRNAIQAQLQSYLGGMPLDSEERVLAAKVLAGQEIKYKTPYGELDAEGVRQLAKENGVALHGFMEDHLGDVNKMDGAAAEKSFNPFNPDNELIKAGRRVSSTIAAAPGQLIKGTASNLARGDGRLLEHQEQLAQFMWRLKNGEAPTAAAENVVKTLGDYSSNRYSDFEKNVMNRAAFFYSEPRNTIPIVARAMMEHLDSVAQIARLGTQPGRPKFVPEYAREGLVIPRGKDANGEDKLTYEVGSPLESAAWTFAQNPISSLNPIPKALIEAGTGRDTFLHKDISEARSAPHWVDDLPQGVQNMLGVEHIPKKNGQTRTEWNPWLGWALRSSPLSRFSNVGSRVSDDRKGWGDVALNLLAGPRTVSVDEDLETRRAQRGAIIDRIKELERQGKTREFTGFAANPDEAGKKDPEAKALVGALSGKKAGKK